MSCLYLIALAAVVGALCGSVVSRRSTDRYWRMHAKLPRTPICAEGAFFYAVPETEHVEMERKALAYDQYQERRAALGGGKRKEQ